MFATVFCATNIIQNNDGIMSIEGLNNTFGIPFTPTLFSFDISAVIAQLDRSREHNLKVNMKDESDISTLLIDLPIPVDSNLTMSSSTTFTTSLRNIPVLVDGVHIITVLIDDQEIGYSKLFFVSES